MRTRAFGGMVGLLASWSLATACNDGNSVEGDATGNDAATTEVAADAGPDATSEAFGDTGPEVPPVGSDPARFDCPVDKPQKIYGQVPGTRALALETPETWTPDNVYLVFGHFNLHAKLTIEAGTVVCFDYEATPPEQGEPHPGELVIDAGGGLETRGAAEQRVVFTQASDQATVAAPNNQLYYKGITAAMGWTEFTLRHTDIYNGGLSAGGSVLEVMSDNGAAPAVTWESVDLYSIQRVGIKLFNYKGLAAGSHVTIHSYAKETPPSDLLNGYPVMFVAWQAAGTIDASTLTVDGRLPDATKFIVIDKISGALGIDADTHLHALETGLAWRLGGGILISSPMNPVAPTRFQIDPGTVIAVDYGATYGGTIFIGDKAGCSARVSFRAVGTAESPILFKSDAAYRGDAAAPGYSPGLTLNACGMTEDSVFEHVRFDGLGNVGDPAFSGAINFIRTDGQPHPGPSIAHTVFENVGGQVVIRNDCASGVTTDYARAEFGNVFPADKTPQNDCE